MQNGFYNFDIEKDRDEWSRSHFSKIIKAVFHAGMMVKAA